jgi:hypothetical protein
MKRHPRVEVGGSFGRWTVIAPAPRDLRGRAWLCRCQCGAYGNVKGGHLACGATKSCGCLAADLARTHGCSGPTGKRTAEYKTWHQMIQRCTNPRSGAYQDYGGRGIQVCDRWRWSFQAFFADMGTKTSPQHSIDRIDVNGNYEPGNCRWATRAQQARNTRRTKLNMADVAAIRAAVQDGETQLAVAARYGIHGSHVCRIANGRVWA